MSEALRRIIDFGFTKMKLTRIELTTMTRNRRSTRFIRRLGFKKEGVLRKYGNDAKMNLIDDAIFSLLRSDWQNSKRL